MGKPSNETRLVQKLASEQAKNLDLARLLHGRSEDYVLGFRHGLEKYGGIHSDILRSLEG